MHVVNIQPELVFQALADATRVRILRVLDAGRGEACLCELVDSLLEPQYKLSRHIKILRQAGLLTATKEGRFVYHRPVLRPVHLAKLFDTIRALPDARGTFIADLRRFKNRMRLRESGRCRIGIQTASLAVPLPNQGDIEHATK